MGLFTNKKIRVLHILYIPCFYIGEREILLNLLTTGI